MSDEEPPEKADEYRHPDGTTEVVFAVEDGTVLTFREYPDATAFRRAVDGATYEGLNREVLELPDVAEFRDEEEV